MSVQKLKVKQRARRKQRVRKKVFGTQERLRLTVYRSLGHIYAQVIDDTKGHTVAAASSTDKEVVTSVEGKTKSERSHLVGKILAQRALSANVTSVVFDRNGFMYHGRVKALADGAREGGLQF
ncbi:MAG TPA: 50S ribosomal protein L18 [Candidatus Kapabacteria bacterium]|jgi:large subunit ribosomal protein L18|nr:50S ribosomal protein L18 [Ignavibacteria bacterium]HRE57445.1 50S ribosomal protein L18 [Candidatus Kapabacteria bacterium]HRK59455.1 50S ribosomal protein L18 [Candidatus Kapabacteria bacterium]